MSLMSPDEDLLNWEDTNYLHVFGLWEESHTDTGGT